MSNYNNVLRDVTWLIYSSQGLKRKKFSVAVPRPKVSGTKFTDLPLKGNFKPSRDAKTWRVASHITLRAETWYTALQSELSESWVLAQPMAPMKRSRRALEDEEFEVIHVEGAQSSLQQDFVGLLHHTSSSICA